MILLLFKLYRVTPHGSNSLKWSRNQVLELQNENLVRKQLLNKLLLELVRHQL